MGISSRACIRGRFERVVVAVLAKLDSIRYRLLETFGCNAFIEIFDDEEDAVAASPSDAIKRDRTISRFTDTDNIDPLFPATVCLVVSDS